MINYNGIQFTFRSEGQLIEHRDDVNPDAGRFYALDDGSTEFEYMQILSSLVGVFKPTHMFETGTWTGSSAIAMMAGSDPGTRFWTFNDKQLQSHAEERLQRVALSASVCLHIEQINTLDLMQRKVSVSWSEITDGRATFAFLDSSIPARALEFDFISNPEHGVMDFTRPLCICIHDMSRYRHPNNSETGHLAITLRRIRATATAQGWEMLRLHQSRGMLVLVKYPPAVGIDGNCIVPELLLDGGDVAQAEAGDDPYLFTEYYPILADLVAAKRPKRILEIGVRYGYSLGVMLDAADSIEEAFAIDVTRVPNDQSWWGGAEGSYARAQYNLALLHEQARWPSLRAIRFFESDTSLLSVLPDAVTDLDFVYIDGGHSEVVCRHDLDLVLLRMSAGGVIAVDDADHDGLRIVAEGWAGEHGCSSRYIPDSAGRGRVVIEVAEAPPEAVNVIATSEIVVENDTLTPEDCIAAAEEFIDRIPPYPGGYEGRGIVMCAGGLKYFTCAWVAIHLLRHLGCSLPIQVWHLGEAEMSDEMRDLLRPLGVECVDAWEVRKQYPCRILNGWEIKAYSIIHSPFREVMLLDADNLCVRDPTYLFECEQFKETGAIFWPDRGRYHDGHAFWRISGVTYQDEPEFESGQIVVDKERCWRPMRLSLWYNEQSDFFYRHLHGDKDTFHMAFRKLGVPYTMAWQSLEDIPPQFHQRDPDGNLLFVHGKKWEYGSMVEEHQGYPHEDLCQRFAADLVQAWSGQASPSEGYPRRAEWVSGESAASALTKQRVWLYGAGLKSTPLVFSEGGRIERGASDRFQTWRVAEQVDGNWLQIDGLHGPTCRLRQLAAQVWAGTWMEGTIGYIELGPIPEIYEDFGLTGEEWFAPNAAR